MQGPDVVPAGAPGGLDGALDGMVPLVYEPATQRMRRRSPERDAASLTSTSSASTDLSACPSEAEEGARRSAGLAAIFSRSVGTFLYL